MKKLEWKKEYSVNVGEMDDQHKKIIYFINDLFDVIKYGYDEREISILLLKMTDYAKYHFSAEERYINEFDCKVKKGHFDKHVMYVKKIVDFESRFNNEEDRKKLTKDMCNFLEVWWINHINKTDKEYSKCFNEHGLF